MNEKILIIDDEEDIRLLIQDLLDDEGYQTLVAKDSDEAYEIIRSQHPNLIIQDIWLQGSEHDGLQILKNIKKDMTLEVLIYTPVYQVLDWTLFLFWLMSRRSVLCPHFSKNNL